MASKIATQSDAYSKGGTKPSGYVATKCCTNAMALACGCANISGYASKRLVPENLLTPAVTSYTLSVSLHCDMYRYYTAAVHITVDDENLANSVRIGYSPNGDTTLDLQFNIEENSNVLVTFLLAYYGDSSSTMMGNGMMNWSTESDLYPNISITDNDISIDIEFTMTSSRQLIAVVNGDSY